MPSQGEPLLREERHRRIQVEVNARQAAVRDAQIATLRRQVDQAAQRIYGVPSTTGLLAYPEEQERRRLPARARRDRSLSPEQSQQAKKRQQAAHRGREMAGSGSQQMGDGWVRLYPSDFKVHMKLEADVPDFSSACQEGDLSTVKSIVSSQSRSELYSGLEDAIKNGKVDVARFLLQSGARMGRGTPAAVLKAPADKHVALFQVLMEHGWTVNTPDSLLPEIFSSNNEPLFDWFLEQGADPNVAGPAYAKRQTLWRASIYGTVQAVQKLLNAGAKMASPGLYWAAGTYPDGCLPSIRRVEPSPDFDRSRIPIMELLLENGGDVNHRIETHSLEDMYPIVHAVKAGAVERVKWLLSKGADPDLQGAWGSARDCAKRDSSDEMKRVLGVEQSEQ